MLSRFERDSPQSHLLHFIIMLKGPEVLIGSRMPRPCYELHPYLTKSLQGGGLRFFPIFLIAHPESRLNGIGRNEVSVLSAPLVFYDINRMKTFEN